VHPVPAWKISDRDLSIELCAMPKMIVGLVRPNLCKWIYMNLGVLSYHQYRFMGIRKADFVRAVFLSLSFFFVHLYWITYRFQHQHFDFGTLLTLLRHSATPQLQFFHSAGTVQSSLCHRLRGEDDAGWQGLCRCNIHDTVSYGKISY